MFLGGEPVVGGRGSEASSVCAHCKLPTEGEALHGECLAQCAMQELQESSRALAREQELGKRLI
eukprot:2209990-Amphidinium_carterae.1